MSHATSVTCDGCGDVQRLRQPLHAGSPEHWLRVREHGNMSGQKYCVIYDVCDWSCMRKLAIKKMRAET